MNIKNKGSGGENEFCKWLADLFGIAPHMRNYPKRNLEQTRSGGADIVWSPFIIEVKRCQILSFYQWWQQIHKAAQEHEKEHEIALIPIVAYRQDRGSWAFLISANHIGVANGYLHIDRFVFKSWAMNIRGL